MNTIQFDLTDTVQSTAFGALVLSYAANGLTFELSHDPCLHSGSQGTVGITLTGGY